MSGGPTYKRQTADERKAQVGAYWQNYRQWMEDTQKNYRNSRSLQEARMAAGGMQRGSEQWNAQIAAADKAYAEDVDALRQGQHYKEIKELWTKGFGAPEKPRANFPKRPRGGSSNENYIEAGATQLAKESVTKQLEEQGYTYRPEYKTVGGGRAGTKRVEVEGKGVWAKGEAKRIGVGKMRRTSYQDVADFNKLVEAESKRLAGDEKAMYSWYDQQFGQASETPEQQMKRQEQEGMQAAKEAAGGGKITKRTGTGGGQGAKAEELAWSITQGALAGANRWI